jgi:glycosyltransferase involved in cell wall biosynthesis
MDKLVSWIGPLEGSGAFSIKNRHLVEGLEARGWTVLPGMHNNHLGDVAPYLISSTYPPRPPKLVHHRSLCLSTWEFDGPGATPETFIRAFSFYDVVWGACQFAADVFKVDGVDHAVGGKLGVDGYEFNPGGDKYELPHFIKDARLVLWVGGTDERHGFDVALEVIKRLPPSYWLIAKQHPKYPIHASRQERVFIIRDDLPSLAPLYRTCDAFLHTARAVGTSMPVMEALACELEVVSGRLPSVEEYGKNMVHWVPMKREAMRHHLHYDCLPQWRTADPAKYANKIAKVMSGGVEKKITPRRVRTFLQDWSWDEAAKSLEEALLNG